MTENPEATENGEGSSDMVETIPTGQPVSDTSSMSSQSSNDETSPSTSMFLFWTHLTVLHSQSQVQQHLLEVINIPS